MANIIKIILKLSNNCQKLTEVMTLSAGCANRTCSLVSHTQLLYIPPFTTNLPPMDNYVCVFLL